MLRRFLRSRAEPDDGGAAESALVVLPLYHRCCREIHQAHLMSQEGRLERDAYLDRKVRLIRAAVRDAEARDASEHLMALMQTLRLACAVNDMELESVQRHFTA